MRMLVNLMGIFVLIVIASIGINLSLHQSAVEMNGCIERVMAEIKQDQWETADKQMSKLVDVWDNKAGWWPIVLDHQEIDNIDFSLARAKEYVSNQSKTLSLGQLSELKLMILHIPEKEKVTLENIF
ncbi:MAG: DUF4363 family protein [Syntrophomonadaceae bacterium]|nr:DUF4363 family protein [Syntrophomonadaceae bacterium]